MCAFECKVVELEPVSYLAWPTCVAAAKMPGFTLDDVLQEVRNIAQLLQHRSDVANIVQDGLIEGALVKVSKLHMTPTSLLSFPVPLANLPQRLKEGFGPKGCE